LCEGVVEEQHDTINVGFENRLNSFASLFIKYLITRPPPHLVCYLLYNYCFKVKLFICMTTSIFKNTYKTGLINLK